MKRIFITGAAGFLGRNLIAHLRERPGLALRCFDRGDTPRQLIEALVEADVVFHLAGVNRPADPLEFETGNVALTAQICNVLHRAGRAPAIVFASSVQAALDNPYGTSKASAERALRQFAAESGARVRIYRLKNLFGKWCRPHYNSVVATFCHNIARDLPIDISDPATEIELTHVDDVVEAFLAELDGTATDLEAGGGIRSRRITLAELAAQIHAFHAMRTTLLLPGLQCWFDRALYATYLSHVPAEAREHPLLAHQDARGSLAEFLKQDCFGQIFVSRTRPGVTRGNHYHHGKSEKFLVLEGSALIRLRDIRGEAIQEYRVTGERYQVIDIPPGFAHSIANVGAGDLVTLFWASEIFDQERPDTYPFPVGLEPASPEQVVPEPIVVESV